MIICMFTVNIFYILLQNLANFKQKQPQDDLIWTFVRKFIVVVKLPLKCACLEIYFFFIRNISLLHVIFL